MINEARNQFAGRTIIVIDKYGYEDLSLRRLTGTLGLTTGAFYKHFKNKND
ncbi:TetR family transcriptional regulator, partial [Lactobacillus crispatus]|uniref:TetR family transcriptional regulator n=1 Tax=Lactobacillus crispatus TaxID=47770 RepID=UPI0025A37987